MNEECTFARDGDSTPICSYHRVPLDRWELQSHDPNPPGLGHVSAWRCPKSEKIILDAGF
jgi:hypothetical protein